MANLSLYFSGQTEQNDVAEFFQKGLMNAGENPIAFFEGVFYESHQERVGNIAFQDYLIYTDKAVYFWARGASKDYLDRFDLGAVSVNSRNKDHDFATLNFKIRRADKDPVYVIFDMVELREAELIIRLHTVIESIIEERLGLNYCKILPDDVAASILRGARGVCIPQVMSFRFDSPHIAQQESHIGYGQDLLEQYKANIGYASPEQPQQYSGQPSGGAQGGERHSGGFSPADALKGIENILPTDPASLKRIAESIKEMIGDAPFKIREQLKNDLQHVPGMLTALNELVISIADNPQAERFVINIVKTAVRNDGMIGSVSKLMKLSSSFGGGGKKSAQKNSSKTSATESNDDFSKNQRRDIDDDGEGTTRRKKLHIKSDDEATLNDDCFGHDVPGRQESVGSSASSKRMKIVDDVDDAPTRKKITIKAPEESVPSIVKSMMSTDDLSSDSPMPDIKEVREIFENSPDSSAPSATRKKVRIVANEDPKDVQPAAEVLSAIVPDGGLLEQGSVIHTDDDSSKNNPFNPGYGVENDNEGPTTHR
ncbi:MAG: hypothetical protein NT163_03580 [Chlorobiales bacterium]|nr:hypothetical protein [Chlorobiales bacterium]